MYSTFWLFVAQVLHAYNQSCTSTINLSVYLLLFRSLSKFTLRYVNFINLTHALTNITLHSATFNFLTHRPKSVICNINMVSVANHSESQERALLLPLYLSLFQNFPYTSFYWIFLDSTILRTIHRRDRVYMTMND